MAESSPMRTIEIPGQSRGNQADTGYAEMLVSTGLDNINSSKPCEEENRPENTAFIYQNL